VSALTARSRLLVAPVCLTLSFLYFSLTAPGFGTTGNAANLLGQAAPLAIVACGQMVVIVAGGFDISVGSVAALACVLSALGINALGPVGLLAGPLTGLACGMVNGALVGRLAVQPVIATLGMLTAARGLALMASHDSAVVLDRANPLSGLGYGEIAGIPSPAFLALGVCLVLWALTRTLRVGRRVYAIGSNIDGARLVGVPVASTTFAAYALSGLTAGIAALVLVGRAGAGVPTEGNGLELMAIAAAVIGGSALGGGSGHPAVVVVGAVFVQSLSSGFDLAGTSPFVREVVLGVVIVLAGLVEWALRVRAERRLLRARLEDRPPSPPVTAPGPPPTLQYSHTGSPQEEEE